MTYDTPLSFPEDDDVDLMQISPVEGLSTYCSSYGAFSPVFEDPSPDTHLDYDPGSSPIGPLTPFGDFIDRAMAKDDLDYPGNVRQPYDSYQDHRYGAPQNQKQEYNQAEPSPAAATIATTAAPSASIDFKKLVDPLSDWLAAYVWKVCTTGAGLPHPFFRSSSYPQRYARMPQYNLAGSIRSLLLSTLLQPSAIFLSLWYIMRLPVYLGPVAFGADYVKETEFRKELLGENEQIAEDHAPFRVFLLGCMLANKWLDDHTFSNKTWHSISNVPIRALNRLEFLSLDIFRHDLSITPVQWSNWLSHLLSYHSSLATPQPISRPSTNPHVMIRKSMEELLQASIASVNSSMQGTTLPEPIFLGLEERKRERLERDEAAESNVDILDIDLDEDGPLREEYLPKRRVSRSDIERFREEPRGKRVAHPYQAAADLKAINAGRGLPPPAKWSPSGDEPILRDRNRMGGHYMAPQPALHRPLAMPQAPFSDNGYLWAFVPMKHEVPSGYSYDHPSLPPSRLPYEYGYSYAPTHVRTQSLDYSQENMQPRHSRSQSQMQAGYGYNIAAQEMEMRSQPFPPDPYYYGYPCPDESYSRFPLRV